ncbi:MAG: N-acetylmuramoyl-L-alanine amidase [Flavobacteriales bacterium]|nr:N-acetylmuramoyl-L-alanine amidase [Flavobacteriales bacterium]
MERRLIGTSCGAALLLALALGSPHGGAAQGRDPVRIRTVVIDPGHGGKDPGAVGTGRYKTYEKDIVLNVGLLAGKYIAEAFPDVKVIYTRDKDHFVELMERSQIANRAQADLFISIHCNSNDSPKPVGAETFVMGLHKTEANMRVAMKENASILLEEGHELRYDGFDPKDPESIIALSLRQNVFLDQSLLYSALVQKQFKERVGRPDRGVKQAGFLVISYTTMPAVLVELGFISNPEEEDFLQGAQGQDYMASAIYRAFKEYKANLESHGATAAPPVAEAAEEPAPAPVVIASGVRFKVQVATTAKRTDTRPANFNGLQGVEEHKGAGLFRYTVGDETTLEAARTLQARCREKGFDGAFIVAYRNGERIDLQEAVKLAHGR